MLVLLQPTTEISALEREIYKKKEEKVVKRSVKMFLNNHEALVYWC